MLTVPIAPGGWLGLLGGGQLGRMFAMSAQSLGYRVAVLDPEPEGPAGTVADMHLVADYDDPEALERLAGLCAAVTTEFENVPAYSLTWLGERVAVSPGATSVAIAQDRAEEKRFITACGLAVTPHAVINEPEDLQAVASSIWPAILKARRLGYDGKGQVQVADTIAALAAFVELGKVPCVLEQRLELAFEISMVVARARDGSAETYPIAQNIHRHGILAISSVPGPSVSPALAEEARVAALRIAERLEYVGVLCVEFFVVQDGRLVVNEIAPRPHNSGHYSIDACVASQFEQQARILAGLPLGSTRLHSPAIMLNLLGDLWFPDRGGWYRAAPTRSGTEAATAAATRPSREPDWAGVLRYPGAKLHLYGKRHARVARKMGHVTVVAANADETLAQARGIAALLGIDPW